MFYYEEEVSEKAELVFKPAYEQLLYTELKKWRNARAEKEGIPPYIIFTNQQLKEIIISRDKKIYDEFSIDYDKRYLQ